MNWEWPSITGESIQDQIQRGLVPFMFLLICFSAVLVRSKFTYSMIFLIH